MRVEIRMVRSHAESEVYIRLPYVIYKHESCFVPPLLRDELRFHDPQHNGAIIKCDTVRFLAYVQGQPVGRIMGIIHHGYNHLHEQRDCRFFQLDCIDDVEVAQMLLTTVEAWGKAMGMTRMIGPFGFSEKDPQGVQIEGRHLEPVIASASHPDYLCKLIQSAGYLKFKECVSFIVQLPIQLPKVYQDIFKRLERESRYRVLSIKSRAQLKTYFKDVQSLLNLAYEHIYGFDSLSEEDIQNMADEYLSLINPQFVKFVEYTPEQRIVGFVLAMPNLAKGFRKANGRLWPWGLLQLIWQLKHSKKLDLLLGGVHPAHQGKGLTALLAMDLMKSAADAGMHQLDSHLILEDNALMCAEMIRLGGSLEKRYRIFQKSI